VPPSFRPRLDPISGEIRESQRRNAGDGSTLRGIAVSPGRVAAPASVIRSATEFDRMMPGTILVCATTTPAWTPLFAQAAGLVTDIGGVAAHGSLTAREYGIPPVMGTGTGTERSAHGRTITVDGDAGLVVPDDAVGGSD
jgi:pyruvate,water dikinase